MDRTLPCAGHKQPAVTNVDVLAAFRAYIAGGTHNTDFDGVCFYPRWSLPG